MGAAKTGALILMEQEVPLGDLERTGIPIDAIVSSQLLINIFEHNTPLHDGAVIIRRNRVAAATCFLPLTDSNEVSMELGTRHRQPSAPARFLTPMLSSFPKKRERFPWQEAAFFIEI